MRYRKQMAKMVGTIVSIGVYGYPADYVIVAWDGSNWLRGYHSHQLKRKDT